MEERLFTVAVLNGTDEGDDAPEYSFDTEGEANAFIAEDIKNAIDTYTDYAVGCSDVSDSTLAVNRPEDYFDIEERSDCVILRMRNDAEGNHFVEWHKLWM